MHPDEHEHKDTANVLHPGGKVMITAAPHATVKPDMKARIENDFTYHAPKGDQVERYGRLRDKGKELALLIVELTPSGHEQSLALTNLEYCVMMANAAIARNE